MHVDARNHRFNWTDLALLMIGSVLSFFFASVLMTGWPDGLKPNLSYPYIYAGDGLFQFWLSQRAIEGWIFENARSGYPFSSSFLDFPGSDSGNLAVLKILGKISGSYFAANNFYLLLGFSAAFGSGFYVLRKLGLFGFTAFSGALLFAFLPYHFSRLVMGHLFYTWYFVVPIYFYAGYRIVEIGKAEFRRRTWVGFALILAISACFGVYFAFFGIIVIATCGLSGFIRNKNHRTLIVAISMCATMSVAVFFNIAPNIANSFKNGKNAEVAQRSPVESELYALKLVHLLLPYQQHRIQALREFTQTYNKSFPLSNTVSSIGIIGILGLTSMMLVFFRSMAGQHTDHRLRILTLLTIVLLFTATVGGINVLFATMISPMIRGWDRISIFIAFFSLAAFFLCLERIFRSRKIRPCIAIIILLLLSILGMLDQTSEPSYNVQLSSKSTFFQDQKFIASIEKMLPADAAVYQMPYAAFPEASNVGNMGGYDLLVGFLNSKTLRWNSGGMQGRPGDLFYRTLAKMPISEQIVTARTMGFSGIYIDRRGFVDGGNATIEEVSRLLGQSPALARDDGQIVFFTLTRQ